MRSPGPSGSSLGGPPGEALRKSWLLSCAVFSAVDGAGALSAAGVAVGAAELGALVFGAIGAVAVDREHDERGRHAANAPAAVKDTKQNRQPRSGTGLDTVGGSSKWNATICVWQPRSLRGDRHRAPLGVR